MRGGGRGGGGGGSITPAGLEGGNPRPWRGGGGLRLAKQLLVVGAVPRALLAALQQGDAKNQATGVGNLLRGAR